MTEHVDSSRLWLRRLCRAGRITGWALVALFLYGIGVLLWILYFAPSIPEKFHAVREFHHMTKNCLLTGLLLLGAIQFVRYLTDLDDEPGRLLRNFHFVLFALAAGLLTLHLVSSGMTVGTVIGSQFSLSHLFAGSLVFVMALLPGLAQAFILAGTGLAVRLVLPIIAESKTLA